MPAILSDALWNEIEAFLPKPTRSPKGGRPAVSNRACMMGILFVLKSGVSWNMLPPEMGCGSGVTCWRRLRDWTKAGVWPKLHHWLLRCLGKRDVLRMSRVVIDSASMRAVLGGRTPAQTRRTAAKEAVNATSSRMRAASHS
jgi:transposase